MRVLFFNYEYPPLGGGAGNATFYILKEFAKIPDLTVDLITSSAENTFSIERVEGNINIHKLPIGDKTINLHYQSQKDLLIYAWKAWLYSRKLLKKNEYSLTHSFFTVPCGFLSMLIKWQYKVPYIVSLRGADVPGYSDRFPVIYFFLKPIIKLIWSQSKAVISNSQGLKDLALKSKSDQEIGIIYNGIDISEFKPREQKNSEIFEILCVSRLTQRKGIEYLISAFAKIVAEFPEVRLKIVGEGDSKEKLQSQTKELGLNEKVEFTGRITHERLPEIYTGASVFVLPSLNEGMSNTMLEALASGLPLIATDTGGTKELVTDGENGFIIKMEDAQDIYEKLNRLLRNNDLRERMAQDSRKKALNLSWQVVASQYQGAYDRVVVSGEKEEVKKKKKISLPIFKFLVSLLFIAWLIYKVKWPVVLSYFRELDIWWMFAFTFLYALGVVISSYKWKILADFKKIPVKFYELFKIYLTGAFINNFFPSIIGGDTYRAYTLGKISNKKYVEATSTVLVDRISGFLGVMVLILIFSLFSLDIVLKNPLLIIVNIIIILSFGFEFFIMILRMLPIWNFVKRFIPQSILHLIKDLSSYRQYRILAKSLLWGIIFNFIGIGISTWMLFLDLHIAISFFHFMIAVSIVSIVSSIPISIGTIGIKEWSYITFFGIFGVNGEAAISIAIFGRFLQMLVSFFAVPFYLEEKQKRDRE